MFFAEKDRGAALIITMVIMLILLGTSSALVLLSTSQTRATVDSEQRERCFAILQAGIAESIMELNRELDPSDENSIVEQEADDLFDTPATDGSTIGNPNEVNEDGWIAFGGGFYRVTAQKINNSGRFRLIAHAILNATKRAAEVIVQADPDNAFEVIPPGNPFRNGLFQGNTEVAFNFEGTGNGVDRLNSFPPETSSIRNNGIYGNFNQRRNAGFIEANADGVFAGTVPGNIYSGGNLNIAEEAFISPGAVARSGGDVNITSTAVDAEQVEVQDNRLLANPERFDYEGSPDVIPVGANDFTSNQAANFGDGGQITEDPNDPRNIFIKNPSRGHAGEINGTSRNDFFLDQVRVPGTSNLGHVGESGADKESFFDSGQGFEIKVNEAANDKVFFIDGNFWLHNRQTFTFDIKTVGEGTRVTFAAQGNVFISDNVVYENLEKDAIAMIALKDPVDFPDEFGNAAQNPTQEGSGNLQFGDPQFGTTFRFSGFMFAENDFFTDNVSNNLFVFGNMTAGNLVNISRLQGAQRNALTIDFDARIILGEDDPEDPLAISLPGLPILDGGAEIGQENEIEAFRPQTFAVKGILEIAAKDNSVEGGKSKTDFSTAPNQVENN